jgi:hypothetical protein
MSVCNETPEELWKAGPFRRMQDASHACLLRFGARKGACLVVGAPKVVWCTHSTLVLVAHNMSVCNQTPAEMWQAGPFRRMQDASHAHEIWCTQGSVFGCWCTQGSLVHAQHFGACRAQHERMQSNTRRNVAGRTVSAHARCFACACMPVEIWYTQGSLLGCWCTKGSLVHAQHFCACRAQHERM